MQATTASASAASYLPLITAIGVSVVTSVSTLLGVYLTQRSTKKMQSDQALVTATLERERREHELSREAASSAREETKERWKQRSQAYVDFLVACDSMRSLALKATTVPEVTQVLDAFAQAQFRALLFAPEKVAYAVLLLDDATRKVAAETHPSKEALEKVRETKALFLQVARKDLGMDGTLSALTRRKATESGTSQDDSLPPKSSG